MIVDAKDLIAGRVATQVAKLALLGNTVDVINADKAVITGKKDFVFAHYRQKFNRGSIRKGPYYPKYSDRLLRRIIRGMLPYKFAKGKAAYRRVMCHVGVPKEFADKKAISFKEAHISKVKRTTAVSLHDIALYLGGKY